MPSGTSISNFLVPPDRIWPLISDFSRWQEWLWIPDSSSKGLGDTIKAVKGEGSAMQLGFYTGSTLKQVCRVKEWRPPHRLMVAMEEYNPKTAIDFPDPVDLAVAKIRALKVYCSVELSTPVPAETKVDMSIEVQFTHFLWGPFFNIVPMGIGGQLRQICDVFLRRFTQSLEKQ